MFGKYQAVFRSRWRAVFWSMGVLLTAYCTVPSENGKSDEEQVAAFAQMVGEHTGQRGEGEHRHVNPWALQPEGQH